MTDFFSKTTHSRTKDESFAQTENLQDIAASETFFCDVTFYICPCLFHRIYTSQILTDDVMTHMVYALISGKCQAIYRCLPFLVTAPVSLNLNFFPTTAEAGFKTNNHNTIREVFAGITIKGYFFISHNQFGKKIQADISYKDDEELTANSFLPCSSRN